MNPFEPKYLTLIGWLKGEEFLRPQDVLREVSKKTKVSEDLIMSKKRDENIVIARHLYCKLARKKLPMASLKEIGDYINIDHSTVIHAIKQVDFKLHLQKKYAELWPK